MTVAQKSYRVLVADDHAVVRTGIKQLLEAQPGVEVCCEATTGVEAIEHVRKGKPDMVLLDLTMPEMNGLDAARQIREISPNIDILVLSMHYTEEIAREVLRSGARGYMLKSDANAELITAVNRVRRGEQYFTGLLAATMAESFAQTKSQWFGGLRDLRHAAYGARGGDHPAAGARKKQ
jgi:two-component system response regulator NreC